ncbi:ABC transporter ATP-binding protein, partial [bacterium]|nr:ABC transporter ATP-binding protein [bacterium]
GKAVLGLLADLNERFGKTVVLITPNSAIAAIGHRVAVIRDGAIREVRVNADRKTAEQTQW